jgi:hypothetical protein
VWRQCPHQSRRQRAWLEPFAIDADQHHPSRRAERIGICTQHIEMKRKRFRPDLADVRGDPQPVI